MGVSEVISAVSDGVLRAELQDSRRKSFIETLFNPFGFQIPCAMERKGFLFYHIEPFLALKYHLHTQHDSTTENVSISFLEVVSKRASC